MKLLKWKISFLFAFLLSFFMCISSFAQGGEEVRGFIVNSLDNRDFPSKSNLSVRALSNEINEMLDFAEENNFNSIFFEARPDDGAMYKSKVYPASDFWLKKKGQFSFYDISKDLIKKASSRDIDVYAVINLDLDRDSAEGKLKDNYDDLLYVSKKYKFKGYVVKNFNCGEDFDYAELLNKLKKSIGDRPLGALYYPDDFTEESNGEILKNTDFVIPYVKDDLGFRNKDGYISALKKMGGLNENVMPLSVVSDTSDVTPVISTKHYEALNEGFSSFVFDGYKDLKTNRNMQMSLLSTVPLMKESVDELDTGYEPSEKFDITRPAENISTTYSTYFIFGTSDPDRALYFRGEKLERNGEDGLWGVKVKLNLGNNYFTFAQGGVSKSVVIRRYSQENVKPNLIKNITKAFPWDNAIFRNGEENTISCIAPSGGNVTAEIGGQWIQLKQSAAAKRGVPALYKGSVTLNDADPQEVKSLGSIEYHLTFNGVKSVYKTKGEVFSAGENAEPYVKTKTLFANVLTPELEFGNFKSIYKMGTEEAVSGMKYANNDWYYELKSGGFIKAADVDVIETEENRSKALFDDISYRKDRNNEYIILKNGSGIPYSFEEKEDGDTILHLYGDFGQREYEILSGYFEENPQQYYEKVTADIGINGIDITFVPYDKALIWGLDIIYEGNDAAIFTKIKPEISNDPLKPLSNLRISIDPGHGGNDSGALGLLGTDGPMEKNANLLNAFILRERLEMLGAEVFLTRENNDDNPSLLERENAAYENNSDIFISIHHNSIVEAADGNEYRGVEAYYYEDFGKKLAELIPQKVSLNNYDRDLRKTETGYYVVTKVRCAPALLTEIGFMPNPYEYEKVCTADEIFKTSEAITAAILEFML